MTRFSELLKLLTEGNVEFVIIGGLAAVVHGSVQSTQDVDVVYSRTPGNIQRLAAALGPVNAYLRGAPPGLPFRADAPTFTAGLNFTLTTDLGWLDLLGEVAGGGRYEALTSHSVEVEVFGVRCRAIDLPTLIATKLAAGRPKDIQAVAELRALLQRGTNR